jgi:DNA-binding response OmpR family regulator
LEVQRILLVGTEDLTKVQKCLSASGRRVVKVSSGRVAVSRAEREIFDAAVVVSTGDEMDLAETVFNLSDIRSSMLILIANRPGSQCNETRKTVARAVPNAMVVAMEELERFLGAEKNEASD